MSNGRRRLHPKPVVGMRFGDSIVVEVIPPKTLWGRRDMRVRLRCVCGRETTTYEFNARTRGRCKHAVSGTAAIERFVDEMTEADRAAFAEWMFGRYCFVENRDGTRCLKLITLCTAHASEHYGSGP